MIPRDGASKFKLKIGSMISWATDKPQSRAFKISADQCVLRSDTGCGLSGIDQASSPSTQKVETLDCSTYLEQQLERLVDFLVLVPPQNVPQVFQEKHLPEHLCLHQLQSQLLPAQQA